MQFRNAWLYDGAVDRFAEVLKLPVAVLACRSCDDARQLPGHASIPGTSPAQL
jgi:hypothetical protein